MVEEWIPIPEFEDYLVSSEGNIYSLKSKKFIKLQPNSDGYLGFSVWNNGKPKTLAVHKLVGNLFLEPVEGLLEIDHINRNLLDNRLCNLRRANRSIQVKNTIRYNAVGYKYITRHTQNIGYIVQVPNIKKKYFRTLDEAIKYRDSLIKDNLSTALSN